MSQKSASQSSNGSAASLERCVEQLLIESDQQEKNQKKLSALKNQFPVLKKIQPSMTNNQKLHLFLRDNHFKQKVQQKLVQNKTNLQEGIPILKIYLVSTRYNTSIQQQFDETDLVNTFSKFGQVNQIYVCQSYAYLLFHQLISFYLSLKVMNQFQVNERIRLRVKICTQEQFMQAHTLFFNKNRLLYEPGCPRIVQPANNFVSYNQGQSKFIVKFELGVQNLPQFNIAQRIIGPKGSTMKKIIQKILSKHPLAHKYNISNIDSVFKMRIRGKGSGFLESGKQSEQKMHLYISSKQKWMYEAACQQVQILLLKIFQDYKVSYQRVYRQHATGIAYKILQYQANYYTQIKRVHLQQMQEVVDLINLENQGKLSQKIIESKIQQRQLARKNGKFQQADQIRNWLKSKGVAIVDSKIKKGKTTWNYIKF